MFETLDKLRNTKQDKKRIMYIQILRKTQKHRNFGKNFLGNYFLKKKRYLENPRTCIKNSLKRTNVTN